MHSVNRLKWLLMLNLLISGAATASPRIGVLDFELNDITSLPNTPAEQLRTAGFGPLLIEALNKTGAYQAEPVDSHSQKTANAGFGYLFRHLDAAAELGQQLGVDWLLVSQHSKPSFLYSQLWVYLIEVKSQKTIARYDIELKGSHEKVTQHSIAALSRKIVGSIERYQGAGK